MYLKWLRAELYLFITEFMAKELEVNVSEMVMGETLLVYYRIYG